MNTRTALAASAAAILCATSADAATFVKGSYTLDTSSFGTQLGVHSDTTQTTSVADPILDGYVNQDGSKVAFSTSNGTLSITGSGEATIYGDPGLENLLVDFDKQWKAVTFNFATLDGASSAFSLIVNGSTTFSSATGCVFCTIGNGQNSFTVTGPAIDTVQFAFNPAISAARQFRVAVGSIAVPEPGTWALMITGFGAAGAMLRSRRTRFAKV